MKPFFTFFLIAFVSVAALTQTYYVAIVKGEVYYNDKKVEKRSKIKLSGTIRFTTKSDYLKVSGPGGLYSLSPRQNSTETIDNEFLLSVQAELFPLVRSRITASNSIMFYSNYYYQFRGFERSFFEKSDMYLDTLLPGQKVALVMETDRGLQVQYPAYNNKSYTLDLSEFAPRNNNIKPGRRVNKIGFVIIKNQEKWETILPQIEKVDDLNDHLNSLDSEQSDTVEANEHAKAGVLLDVVRPYVYNRKAFTKDMKRHIKISKPISLFDFMENMRYEEYVLDHFSLFYNEEGEGIIKSLIENRN